ncbi:pentapeptide repeat-containing protein [Thalassospira xiamenensis]|uniref:pentapeptide repeat-containing protein n=1 Tax=Thalassospira xiamenensis TaxID=220697 RepID=UPI003AA7F8E3
MPTTNLSRPHRFYIAKRYFKGHSDTQSHPRKTENEIRDMTEKATPERQTLAGEAALKLWRQGRDAWNNWIYQHPDWDISFAGVDFSCERNPNQNLFFSGYRFGDGNVDFTDVTFGDGDVNFNNANFGDGNVNFSNATFGDGTLDFAGVTFGKGNVNFTNSTFGRGKISFSDAKFDQGNLKFSVTKFGGNLIDFSRTNFDNRYVSFYHTNIGEGVLVFSGAKFKNCNLDFFDAIFGAVDLYLARTTFDKGGLNFLGATFGKGILHLSAATFNDGDVFFAEVSLGNCVINLSQAQIRNLHFNPKMIGSSSIEAEGLSIEGRAIFTLPSSASKLKSLNLRSASFDGPLTLKGDLSIIPDLRATRYSHQVDLSALTVKLRRRWQKPGRRSNQWSVKAVSETGIISRLAYKLARKKWINLRYFNRLRRLWKHHCWPIKLSRVAEAPQDGARLRRLKEIAETNKDHQAALRFSADENRAKRWIETPWLGSILDMAFSFFCNYGQSILRPTFWLGVIFALSTYAYKSLATVKFTNELTAWVQAFILSTSNSLPFLPQSRELRTGALLALYDTTDPSSFIDALMITQGVLSFIFLFLIGLGLRNRFRL